MSKDYYKVLSVSKSATLDEIKKAYRKLALEHHPDRGGGPEAEKKFKEANEAYQILSDPQKRSQYDQFGDAAFRGGNAGGQGFGGFSGFQNGGFDFSNFGFGGGLGDIFEDLFGQQMAQVQAEIRISPAQAVLGDRMQIQVEDERIDLDIPAGVQDGTSFRLAGRGRALRNGKKGDLILTVNIVMPKHISNEQKELWEKLRQSETKKKWWNA